jgi:hypothetical protein
VEKKAIKNDTNFRIVVQLLKKYRKSRWKKDGLVEKDCKRQSVIHKKRITHVGNKK